MARSGSSRRAPCPTYYLLLNTYYLLLTTYYYLYYLYYCPMPYDLYPIPYTLYPIPYTLYPALPCLTLLKIMIYIYIYTYIYKYVYIYIYICICVIPKLLLSFQRPTFQKVTTHDHCSAARSAFHLNMIVVLLCFKWRVEVCAVEFLVRPPDDKLPLDFKVDGAAAGLRDKCPCLRQCVEQLCKTQQYGQFS